ncbi:MAG: ABC transporter substrate binding protein [Thermodesulfobacteriota bacterium]|nr:ABC transporter substrate binding protein [Thermodesulfobacteriota bacterium]
MAIVLLVSFGSALAPGKEISAPKVALVVSQNIRPYVDAVEGLSAVLSGRLDALIEVFFLEKFRGKGRGDLSERLVSEKFDLFVAIGPASMEFVWSELESKEALKLYSMVLHPEARERVPRAACGISLNIPIRIQVERISSAFPFMGRVGVLHDSVHNADFVRKAAAHGLSYGLEIVPLRVSSRKDIPIVLGRHLKDLDALWLIPDHTVITESLVRHIIKEAISGGVAVIGYNRFFYESGAALAFVFDYREIGEQTARLAIGMLSGEKCKKEDVTFHTWLNLKVTERLGFEDLKDGLKDIEVRP